MAKSLTEQQIQHWRDHWEKANADAGWVRVWKETDQKRQAIQQEILELMRTFRQGKIVADLTQDLSPGGIVISSVGS